MKVGYLQKTSDGSEERIVHSTHETREEAHAAAVALADSFVGNENILHVERGYAVDDTTYLPRVTYSVPPTDEQRNPT